MVYWAVSVVLAMKSDSIYLAEGNFKSINSYQWGDITHCISQQKKYHDYAKDFIFIAENIIKYWFTAELDSSSDRNGVSTVNIGTGSCVAGQVVGTHIAMYAVVGECIYNHNQWQIIKSLTWGDVP